ncbi:hypothetical protein ACP70R_045534 [Stipagrostis hirtigluma subsp. patula]
MAQPPAKRMKLAVPVGPPAAAAAGEAASPRSRRLRQTLLVVLFMVRVSVRSTVPASVSQIGGMLQRYVDHAFRKCHDMISRKLDTLHSKQDALQGQVYGLHNEMRQLARTIRHAGDDQHSGLEGNLKHAAANIGSNTNTHLCFLNDLKPPIYTGKNITDKNNAPIKVAIFEGDEMITSGPLSKVKVEILVLRGDLSNDGRDDWTEEEFDRLKVPGREGQDQMLGTARLRKGVAELRDVRFREGSCRRKLIMGARVCKSEKTTVRVREALTKPVTVLDRRNKPNEKRHLPRLDDEVYRLEEIAKNGAYHNRLLEKGISTVQDLLKAFNKDPDELRKILNMKQNSWSKMINHARKCFLEDKQELKRYQSVVGNVAFFFNCVHNLVGAAFPHDYVDSKGFNPFQKALVDKWLGRAYKELEGIEPNYVMKGNIPEPISPGNGATGNWPHNVNNPVTEPMFPTPNYGPMIASHDLDVQITQDYQGQKSQPHGQQQILSTSTGYDWQQNAQGTMDSPGLLYQVDIASISEFDIVTMLQDPAGPSTSAHLPQPHELGPAVTPAWTMAAPAQPSFANQEPGPSCPAFPGSGQGNDC